jgi:hypothetical protein
MSPRRFEWVSQPLLFSFPTALEDLREAHAALDQSQGGQTDFDRDRFQAQCSCHPNR